VTNPAPGQPQTPDLPPRPPHATQPQVQATLPVSYPQARNAAQAPTQQLPYGHAPQPGPYPTAQYPQTQPAQTQYTQAQYPQTQPAQTQYAQTQYTQAQYPQAQYPQTQHSQAQYPQTQHSQAQYPAPWPGGPGVPSPYGPPPSRKNRAVAIGVVAAVVVIGGLGTGAWLTWQQARDTLSAAAPWATIPTPDVPGPLGSPPPLDGVPPGGGTTNVEELAVSSLASTLQVYLNAQNADGLLLSVCDSGKVNNRARDDLMGMSFLNPSNPQYANGVTFPDPTITPTTDGYTIAFSGADSSTGESIDLSFRAYVDDAGAFWCGFED
jgi:hypothetical protein